MVMKYFIYGVTAIGKTTYAKRLATEKKLEYICGDALRYGGYPTSKEAKRDEYINYSSKNAWKIHSDRRTKSSIADGIKDARKHFNKYLERYLLDKDNYVIDATPIDPNVFVQQGIVQLAVCSNEQEHMRRMWERDTHKSDRNAERLDNARALQEHLVDEAIDLGIEIVDLS
jgi:2-phosphoglycerate kinase